MQDSPSTPATPESPHDITVSVAECEGATAKSIPARRVSVSGTSVPRVSPSLQGVLRVCRDKNRTPTTLFEPSSCEAAKIFLSATRLPPRFPNRDPLETPKSSRQRSTTMICHGCHMHMGQGAHNGSAPGKNLCTLPHSVSCQGNIVEDDSWKACPDGYVFLGQSVPTSGFLDTMSMTDFMSSTPALNESRQVRQSQLVGTSLGQTLMYANQSHGNLSNLSVQPPTQFTVTGPVQSQPSNPNAVTNTTIPVTSTLTTSHPQSAPTLTPVCISITVPTPPTGSTSQPPPSSMQQLEYDMQRLQLQSMGQGARPKSGPETTVQTLPDSYHQQQVEALRAANQQQPGQNLAHGPGTLNIAALRAMPGLQSRVEKQWQDLRGSIPALSAARTAQLPGVDPSPPAPPVHTLQVPGVQNGASYNPPSVQQTSPAVLQTFYPNLASLPGQIPGRHPSHQAAAPATYYSQDQGVQQHVGRNSGAVGQVLHPHHPYQHVQGVQGLPQGHTPDHQAIQGQVPQPLYKLEYRCSPTSGRTFQVLIPVQGSPLRAAPVRDPIRYEWRCDPITGQTYQVPVSQSTPQVQPAAALQIDSQHSAVVHHHQAAGPQYSVPQQSSSNQTMLPSHHLTAADQYQHPLLAPSQQPAVSPQQQVHLKGISPLTGEVGATKKAARVIDFAKRCPVKWSKLAKPDTINLPLYSYGAVTELEAALSGRGEPLSDEVLLAKICHLKNIFEVCCLNSSPTDFCSYGWQIARDYATKVEDEVEQRFVHWHDMAPGIRTQTLVLSQMEYPRAPVKKKQGEETQVTKKDRCSTFNTCMTEMKCEYEVSNPGRTCQRKHECTWCRKNLQQGYKHQEWKCQKKQAAGQ